MLAPNKTIDAIAESRKWREATSRKLDAMGEAERLAYLKKVGERSRVELRARSATSKN